MREIIKDITLLQTAAEPLEFRTETGITKDEGEQIMAELTEVMEADKSILALSAPQIGINKRVFCIRFEDTLKFFIDPIITKKSGSTISPETFVSMPGKEILIARPDEITTVYYTNNFKYEDNKLLGPAARLFEQQVQLLDGITPDYLGLVSDVEQDGSLADLTEEEKTQVVELYKKYIATKLSKAKEEIDAIEDETIKKQYSKMKFAEDVINGRTQVIDQGMPANRATRRAMAKKKRARK